MKLTEIAKRIDTHLKRFEADPKINSYPAGSYQAEHGLRRFYNAGAVRRSNRISVWSISYQGASSLTKAEAAAYLAWLDAGNVGLHYEGE